MIVHNLYFVLLHRFLLCVKINCCEAQKLVNVAVKKMSLLKSVNVPLMSRQSVLACITMLKINELVRLTSSFFVSVYS